VQSSYGNRDRASSRASSMKTAALSGSMEGRGVGARLGPSKEECGGEEGRATMAEVGESIQMRSAVMEWWGSPSRFVLLAPPKQSNGHGRMKPLAAGGRSTQRRANVLYLSIISLTQPPSNRSPTRHQLMTLLGNRAWHCSTISRRMARAWKLPQLNAGFVACEAQRIHVYSLGKSQSIVTAATALELAFSTAVEVNL
jgi:hypothetical protein